EQRQHAADQRQRHRPNQQERIAKVPKCAVEQEENDYQTHRNDDFQAFDRSLKFLEFSRPFVVIALWEFDLLREFLLRFGDRALQIAPADAELDRNVARVIFAVDKGRAGLFDDLRNLLQWDAPAIRSAYGNARNGVDVLAILRQEPDDDVK